MSDRIAPGWPVERRRATEPQRSVTLTDVVRVPISRWRTVVVTAVIFLVAAVGYVMISPPSVTATAVVAVRPVVTDAFTPAGQAADRSVNMNVESGIATSTEVMKIVAQERGGSVADIRDALEIEVPAGGQILRMSYTADSAEKAVEMVNFIAQTYLDVRRKMYERQRSAMLDSYDDSIAKVTRQRETLQRRIASGQSPSAEAALAELNALNAQLAQLNASRAEIAAIDVTPGWITQSAEIQTAKASSRMLYVLAGGLGGVLLGVVVAYIRESTQRVVRTAAEAHEAATLPLLGTVRSRGYRARAKAVDADVRYVAMAIAERFRHAVRTPVVVIASRPREDTTLITASLAVALAADGKDVYVGDDSGRIDQIRAVLTADLRKTPAQASSAGNAPSGATAVNNATVATTSLAERDAEATIALDVDATVTLPRITSTTSTQAAASPQGVMTATMAEVPVRKLSPEAVQVGTGRVRVGPYQNHPDSEIVLFNAPPAEFDERGVREARRGTAIVVVQRNETRVEDLRRLVGRLRAAGAEPLGYVFTRSGRG